MKIFNTNFEISMRILLLLSIYRKPIDIETIMYLDFFALYSKNYGFNKKNINGDLNYVNIELSNQYIFIKKAIIELVLKDFLIIIDDKSGFLYTIKKERTNFIYNLKNNYSKEYKKNVKLIIDVLDNIEISNIKKYAKNKERDLDNEFY
ncbi:MAG: ABC-three component system middle component 2 [Metamycoplasmataceae bacterium]